MATGSAQAKCSQCGDYSSRSNMSRHKTQYCRNRPMPPPTSQMSGPYASYPPATATNSAVSPVTDASRNPWQSFPSRPTLMSPMTSPDGSTTGYTPAAATSYEGNPAPFQGTDASRDAGHHAVADLEKNFEAATLRNKADHNVTEQVYATPGYDRETERTGSSTKQAAKRSQIKAEVVKPGRHIISRSDMQKGWLYVVSLGTSRPGYDRVKVGFSSNTEVRTKQYKTANPHAILIFEKYTIKWAESQALRMLEYFRVADSASEAGCEVFELPNIMAERVCMCAYELTGYIEVELRFTTFPEPRFRLGEDFADDTAEGDSAKTVAFSA
jgi:hypothetical protein